MEPYQLCPYCGVDYERPVVPHIVRTLSRPTLPGGPEEYLVLADHSVGTSLLHICEVPAATAQRIEAAKRIVSQETGRSLDDALRLIEEVALVADVTLEEVAREIIEGNVRFDEP